MQGLILINKPSGMTSFSAVNKIKWLAQEKRVGHTGTLDPRATGLLPIFIGRATALAGIVLSLAWITAPRWLTAGIYLLMGWLVLFAMGPLIRALPPASLAGLAAGGALYSIGGVLYALKWPGRGNPRFGCHEIFHLFILLGSAAHYAMMYTAILAL